MADLFRIFHPKTGKWREIRAVDAAQAVEISGWKAADCEVRVKTAKGGWANVGIAPRAIRNS